MMSNRKFGQGLAASGDGGQQFRAMVSCRKGQGLICVTSGRKVNILVGGMSRIKKTTRTRFHSHRRTGNTSSSYYESKARLQDIKRVERYFSPGSNSGLVFHCEKPCAEYLGESGKRNFLGVILDWDNAQVNGTINVDHVIDLFNQLAALTDGATTQPTQAVQITPKPKPDENVRDIQAMLSECGFKPGPADGLWGRKTTAAATAFVKAHGGSPSSDRTTLLAQVDGNRVGDAGPCPRSEPAESEPAQGRDVQTVKKMLENRSDATSAQLNLSGLDLSNGDFTGQDFGSDNLANTDFSKSNLAEADMSQSNLKGANFKDAILDRANLVGQDLRETVLTGASMAGTALAGARFSVGTGLTMAQASTARWAGKAAQWIQEEAIEDFNANVDKIFTVIVEEDGGFRFPAD